jgi:magnesium-protoporphyrin O-methyltransferase
MALRSQVHESAEWKDRRAWLHEYFDRTAAKAWASLTSDDKVSRIRQTVREGRDQMRGTMLSWLPADLGGCRVLDAGCGTGLAAIELARRGAEVVAIDLSPTLVGLAQERLAHDPRAAHIDWRSGDMLDPALGAFDHVFAMDSLIHYDAPELLGAVQGLAARVSRSMVFTFAPATPLLSTMHAVGKLFPRRDRAPMIQPIAERAIRAGVAGAGPMHEAGWHIGRTQRVQRGFYTSQAIELSRPVTVAGAADAAAGAMTSGVR